MKIALSLVALLGSWPLIAAGANNGVEAPTTTAVGASTFHCQVPCGIYGDKLRIDMLMEDAATIRKAMAKITEMEGGKDASMNQMVRWLTTKEQHAQKIQDTLGAYWLAQRIKAPNAATAAGAMRKYVGQLMHAHGMIVSAMKCKQTTDAANVDKLIKGAQDFSATYFSAEDLKHLKEHSDEHKK